MSSSSSPTNESPPPEQPQQQQHKKVRKPLFADWPTIKILTPPQGRFSPKTDEWCFTYCTQSVRGRINGAQPECHYTCLRKVFPHEVRNVLSFKKHMDVGPDGKAKYPLPVEGQPAHLPRILGGTSKNHSDDSTSSSTSPKYWDEGWYLATGHGRWAAFQEMDKMFFDLEKQSRIDAQLETRKEVWQDYQDKLKQNVGGEPGKAPPMWWASIMRPSLPPPYPQPSALLVPLPPDFPPLMDKIKKLLAPTHQVLGILHESITSGEQKQFALRLWEKAKTDEPFILAQRACSRAYEQWKRRVITEEDEKKGSP